MATTNFCELAAYYLDLVESDGLDYAGEAACESMMCYYECEDDLSDMPAYEVDSFIAHQLNLMHEVEELARGTHHWCPNWLDNISALHAEPEAIAVEEEASTPCVATALGVHPWKWLAHYKVQRAFQLSSRYALRTRKFSRWELTDINGDRVEVYTEYPLTIAEASRELSEFYSVSRIQGLA